MIRLFFFFSLVSWRSLCTGGTGVLFVQWSSSDLKTSWITSVTGCVCTWSRRAHCSQRCLNQPRFCQNFWPVKTIFWKWFVLQVTFFNPVIERRTKLRRQKKIFSKQQGKYVSYYFICSLKSFFSFPPSCWFWASEMSVICSCSSEMLFCLP